AKASYPSNPLEDEELKNKFQLITAPVSTLTLEALKSSSLSNSQKQKCKNFFALGIVFWLFNRSLEVTTRWIEQKFKADPELCQANLSALHGGMAFAQASELFHSNFEIRPAKLPPGTYRNITGNAGIAYGLLAASVQAKLPLFYAGYPITPASDILHEIARHKSFGAITFQAEDEIAAACAAIGASYAGQIGVTASSGPGILLKQEAINLALIAELPLVILNIQRAGPSTGMPTRNEQTDLLSSLYGRNGESPIPIVAVSTPSDAFDATVEACRIAVEYMTPVFLMSDGSIGNGSEPWRIPELESITPITPKFAKAHSTYEPYARDPKTLTRTWAVPGTAGLEHRIGGLERQDITGAISYDPINHEKMVALRAGKVEKIAEKFEPLEIAGDPQGDLLVLGWGSTLGAISAGVERARRSGLKVSRLHLRHLNPLPRDLGAVLSRFKKVLVAELNSGQLLGIIRSKYLIDAQGLNKIQGQPFKVAEIQTGIEEALRR
ncbi:MAG: 2-oxoacid:acceptor oxidoreductase subunit alpha, partial [Bdellovibrionales bacterium]|nr:2-oxoacid:acceptor oxidoreductase subunit alpha [Bdellovibrionales bacterium]